MFGNLIDVYDNYVILENKSKTINTKYLNLHVVFNDNNRKIVGEIISIDKDTIKILLVGEIKDDVFLNGIVKKPNLTEGCRIIYKSEVELLLGKQDLDNVESFYIGKSLVYDNFNITGNFNDFFSNHFAIVGNTGSGKSCSVARILQNIFYKSNVSMPKGAHIVLFDVYGEYNKAFTKLNNIEGMGFKNYVSDINNGDDLINIPAYFLGVDDLALLLNVNTPNQLPILEKTLKLVYIFNNTDENISQYKDDIIANCLLDILTSGRTSTQIRDHIVAVLSRYNTETLNLETEIVQPGYIRSIRQCLNIDAQGKMNSVQYVVDLLAEYRKLDLGEIPCGQANFTYTLEDIYYALEFALISEGVLKSDKMYDEYNQLKVRLQQIINSDYNYLFKVDEYITKDDYVRKLFDNERKCQIINFNLNNIDERFAKKLAKIFSKIFFDFTTTLNQRASYPIHIILEEAHRYVQNDNDVNILGYNIFDRITKEGRKYGVILGLITQRPSELSITALSQCSNFMVLRMFYPDDLNIIRSITTNLNEDIYEKIKSFLPGNALVFGISFKLPLVVSLDLPNPMPESTSVNISNIWYK